MSRIKAPQPGAVSRELYNVSFEAVRNVRRAKCRLACRARLLADLAEVTALTSAFGDALAGGRQRTGGHDPGQVITDMAVMLADGGETISDLAVLRDQAELFGPVASPATAWRVPNRIDEAALGRMRAAKAAAREIAWAQHADTREKFPQTKAAGRAIPGLVVDIDATIVICHSEKEQATPT